MVDHTDSEQDDKEAAAQAEAAPAEAEPVGIGLVEEDPLQTAQDEIQTLEARLRTVSAAYKTLQEETTAQRERMERQANLQKQIQRGEVVATLFEPLDNLKRSIEAIGADSVGDDARAGLKMVVEQFMRAFEEMGLQEVPGVGSLFDPTTHEALSIIPVTDTALDGRVIEVFSAGYQIGGRLLQPARVVIGAVKQEEEPAAES